MSSTSVDLLGDLPDMNAARRAVGAGSAANQAAFAPEGAPTALQLSFIARPPDVMLAAVRARISPCARFLLDRLQRSLGPLALRHVLLERASRTS